MKQCSINGIEDPDQSPLRTRRGEQLAVRGERKACDPRVVRHDKLGPLRRVVLDANLALLQPGADQDQRRGRLRDRAEALRVRDGLYLVEQLQVREVVHVHLLLQNDDDPVATEPHRTDLGPERELTDAPALMVVPDHDFVGRVLRVRPAADEGQDVAPEEHLDGGYSSVGELPPEDLAERVAVEDSEAMVCTHREAPVVLVERQVEQRPRIGRRRLKRLLAARVRVLVVVVELNWLVRHGGFGV